VNLPFATRANRPYPDWGVVSMNSHLARSAYHALQTGLTRRFSNRWQANATYTLSGLWSADTKPFSGLTQVAFETAPDLGGEWGLSADDVRHRGVINGIWQVGRGFQVSGLHFFAAGIRQNNTYGGDFRNTGVVSTARLRPDGTIVPRNVGFGSPSEHSQLRIRNVEFGMRDRIPNSEFQIPNWRSHIWHQLSVGDTR